MVGRGGKRPVLGAYFLLRPQAQVAKELERLAAGLLDGAGRITDGDGDRRAGTARRSIASPEKIMLIYQYDVAGSFLRMFAGRHASAALDQPPFLPSGSAHVGQIRSA